MMVNGMKRREKSTDHLFRQKKVEMIERNENRVRIIDFGVSYDSLKRWACEW